jgi:hypothetical protein
MDRSITEWLLALSEEYEKKEKKSALQQTIQEELLETLSLITQDSLPQKSPEPEVQHEPTPQAQSSQQAPTPAAPQKKRSDEEILQALLELKQSGKLQRSFSQKATHTFASILRPKKP